MADEAHAIRRLLDNNPRDMSRDEILNMYETRSSHPPKSGAVPNNNKNKQRKLR